MDSPLFSLASSTAALNGFYTDAGVLIGIAVIAVVAAVAALIGLGWGMRAAKKHVTGKKF